jgi:membrane protease YdiL (CAAX protease family)
MTETSMVERPASKNAVTWFGLAFSMVSMLVIRQIFRAINPEPRAALVLVREACFFASAGALFWLIRRCEKLSLRSIGIGTSPVWKSLAWGVVITVACFIPALVIAHFTGYGHGAASKAFDKLPLWAVSIVVLRAGVVEELFFRGYAIERLEMLGFGRVAACIIPLTIFSVGHWTGGAANILIAFVVGGVLTAFYLWRRDLVANMFGHFLVDFVGNVLPRLFS